MMASYDGPKVHRPSADWNLPMVLGEQARIRQHGSDVFELDARLGKIRDVADGAFDFRRCGLGLIHLFFFSIFSIMRRSFRRAMFWICRTRSRVT